MSTARVPQLREENLEQLTINTIRTLAIDAVQQAKRLPGSCCRTNSRLRRKVLLCMF
jgi:hypothetical protein